MGHEWERSAGGRWRGNIVSPPLMQVMGNMRKERDEMDEMLKMVGNFGFPIVVSAYLLVRVEGKLSELTLSITELAKAVAVIKA